MRALLLVAHPDDEILFAGGLLLSHPEVEWTVCCATYHGAHERGERFAESCAALGSRGVTIESRMLGLEDVPRWLSVGDYGYWNAHVRAAVGSGGWNLVVTHNRMGEYGHPHHMALSAIALDIFECPVWHFLCRAPSGVGEQEKLSHFHKVPLDGGLLIPKRSIFEGVYGDELSGLRLNQPELVQWCFGDRELFTGASGWPS